MITVKNMEAAFAAMDKWLADVEATTREAAVSLSFLAFEQVLLSSPQYSGDFAANWRLSVNAIDVSFHPQVFPEKEFPTKVPFKMGDSPAIMYAISQNTGRLSEAVLGDTLWLANTASHDELYAWKIENNLVRLRPENFGGEGPLGRAREYIKTHYSRIDKHNIGRLQ